jgi:colanic acid/amylovoran biosynthesis glycosyltransferase
MRLAYLVNQYPAVSHSFIRREILAVEALGHEVRRFSIRPAATELPDPGDQEEARKTSVVLSGDLLALFAAALTRVARHPFRVVKAFKKTRTMTAPSLNGYVRRFAYLMEGIWVARELERAGVRHLHAHFGTNPAAVARIVWQVSGIPYSFTVHGPDEFDEPEHIDLGGKISDASFVAAISDYGRSQLCRWARLEDWGKLVVVRCGLDIDQIGNDETQSPKEFDLCTVARLAPQKGLPILIDALEALAHRGTRPSVAIIGDGPLRGQLERQAQRCGVASQISFLGARDGATVMATLRRSKVMVLPSFAEGLPVVIMEAFAAGTPVATTSIAGIPELVDSSCGWVVPAGSATSMAEAISQALATPQPVLNERGRRGRQRVVEQHDVRVSAAQLSRCFEKGRA